MRVVSHVDPSVHFSSDARWEMGSIMALALASSEVYFVDAWNLKKSQLRRFKFSGATTIFSAAMAGPICDLIGVQIREMRAFLFWRWASVAIPLFVLLTLTARAAVKSLSETRQK